MIFTIVREKNKRNIILYSVVSLLFAVISAVLGVHPAAAAGGAVLLFAVLFVRLEISDKFPVRGRFLLLLILTLLVFILMQITISCGIFLIGFIKFLMNIIILFGLSSLLWMVTGNVKISVSIITVFCYIIAIADHIVVQARSFEIQFSDLSSLSTAAAVAGGYSFALSATTKIGICLGIIFLTFLLRSRIPSHVRSWKRTVLCLASITATILCTAVIYTQFGAGVIGYQDKYWMYRGSERNGFWVNMIYSASATRVTVPDGYDALTLKDELDKYLEDADSGDGSLGDSEEKPNVIVIMNETFSDVQNITSYLGREMPTSISVTPFLDSLSDEDSNVIKGHAIASVYGGNTANSELEFLSQQSIQFIPRNTVAYNLYVTQSNSFSIISNFKNAGYRTVGMHPENPVNWQRDKIYSFFNFDEKYFMDDFTGLSDDDWYRGHISDRAVYDKIIELYETKDKDDVLFTFAVTMQNHGGFTSAGFDYTVDIEGFENYTGIKEYLSSINNADTAFRHLIEYFSCADEKTIIVFYGDHQPSLSNIALKFYGLTDESGTEAQLAKYAVPYVIWANYDIGCERATPLTSINFLSSWLLDIVDADMTPFQRFVKKLNGDVMAINAMGWYDYDGQFHESNYINQSLSDPLGLYARLQYNAMYDNKNRQFDLFGCHADNGR